MTATFWAEGAAGRLVLQRCTACHRLRALPAPVCPFCMAETADWSEVSGRGTVYAATEIFRAPDAALAAEAPYMVGLVELDEGPRLLARLTAPVAIGAAVRFAGTGDSGAGPWLRFTAPGEQA